MRFAFLSGLLIFGGVSCLWADVVSSVSARQRWPWNGLVDIDCRLEGKGSIPLFRVAFKGEIAGEDSFELKSLSGAGMHGIIEGNGTYRTVWDSSQDLPGTVTSRIRVGVTAEEIATVRYVKVDLATGELEEKDLVEPVIWSAKDKSDYLWLRRIVLSSFMKTEIFYIGVFETTRDQYAKIDTEGAYHDAYSFPDGVMGAYPANKVSYVQLLGHDFSGSGVLDNSFFGLLRAKVKGAMGKDYAFTLPTEQQWQEACRATHGLDSWNDGVSASDTGHLDILGWHSGNSLFESHEVGLLNPSSYGLYDMHGNVSEHCLDMFAADSNVAKGGNFCLGGEQARTDARLGAGTANICTPLCGFRVVLEK